MVAVITKEVVVEDSAVETAAALDKHLLRGAKTTDMEAATMEVMAAAVDMVAVLKAATAAAKEATAVDLVVEVEVAGEANKAEVVEAAVAQSIPGTKEEVDKAALAVATPGETMVQVVKVAGEVTLAGAMVATVVAVDMEADLKAATAAVAKEATAEDLAVDKVEVKGAVLVQ